MSNFIDKLTPEFLQNFDPESLLPEDFPTGTLEKLRILSFNNGKLFGLPTGVFIPQFNPEKYSLRNSISFEPDKTTNAKAIAIKFQNENPKNLSLVFKLDGTGVASEKIPVTAQLKLFEAVTGFDGLIHAPRFLLIVWGTLVFPCRLTSRSVEYSLFNPQGIPLRATLTAEFQEYYPKFLQDLKLSLKSPDLTKYRIVGAHDTLPLMCKEIYGDEKYYLEVAKINNLTNFRKLTVGQQLTFPPLA